jgi:hypothetical protein
MDTATLAEGPATEATATRSNYHTSVVEALTRLAALNGQLKALQDTYDHEEAELIELLDGDFSGSMKINGRNFTVVRAVRNIIDSPKAIQALVRRRLYKQLVVPQVDHGKFMDLVASGVFPDLEACVRKSPNKPFIKIS